MVATDVVLDVVATVEVVVTGSVVVVDGSVVVVLGSVVVVVAADVVLDVVSIVEVVGSISNCAVMDFGPSMVTLQLSMPEHPSPLQPVNAESVFAVAVNGTEAP